MAEPGLLSTNAKDFILITPPISTYLDIVLQHHFELLIRHDTRFQIVYNVFDFVSHDYVNISNLT